jgi:hypothetical protein
MFGHYTLNGTIQKINNNEIPNNLYSQIIVFRAMVTYMIPTILRNLLP